MTDTENINRLTEASATPTFDQLEASALSTLHLFSPPLTSLPAPHKDYSAHASSPLHVFIERLMTCCFPLSFAAVIYLCGTHLAQHDLLWVLALAVPLGWVTGDFVTGVVHWAADTYGSTDTFIVGPHFVKPFRLHHQDPKEICSHDIFVTIGNTCILAVPLMILCFGLVWPAQVSTWRVFAVAVMAMMTATTVVTNLFHKWAHADDPPRLIRALQRVGLVLSPAHHETHHTHPHHHSYCITNGWCNPLLDRIKFFRRLERALAVCRIRPSRESG